MCKHLNIDATNLCCWWCLTLMIERCRWLYAMIVYCSYWLSLVLVWMSDISWRVVLPEFSKWADWSSLWIDYMDWLHFIKQQHREMFKVLKIILGCLICIEVQKGHMMDTMFQHVGATSGPCAIGEVCNQVCIWQVCIRQSQC